MNDSLGALIAIVVLWSILRFAFGGGSNPTGSGNAAPALNTARSRQVPQHMVDSVKTLFPHISDASIRYDLQRSGSVEATCERILNEGGLPSPPAGFFGTAEPSTPSNAAALRAQNANRSPNGVASASSSSVSTPSKSPNLISRYGLQSRIGQEDVLSTPDSSASTSRQGSPSAWATTPEARAKLLQDRKEQMILQARRKLMERQQNAAKEAADHASGDSAANVATASS